MTSGAMWAYDPYIDDPAVVAAERARLTLEFTAETARVVAAESLRQFDPWDHDAIRPDNDLVDDQVEPASPEAWVAIARARSRDGSKPLHGLVTDWVRTDKKTAAQGRNLILGLAFRAASRW